MDEQENPLERNHSLCVVLPGGLEKNATVHGSKPVMDLLVTLCASHHLNPSDYTVEVLSPNKNNISFKPNSPVGLLEAEKIVLKPRALEEKEKIRRPYMPEATVRLLINYSKSHKTVVRVNPRLPLEMLLPMVCEKCELQVATTSLLRDSQSKEPLDLSKTLNDHGLREVFAKDSAQDPTEHHSLKTTEAAAVTPTEVISPPPLQDPPKKEKKLKENSGFFSLFRRRKKKHEKKAAVSAPASPGHSQLAGDAMNLEGVSSSNTLPADMPKKRRAPQPPMGASQSVPNNLDSCHSRGAQRSGEWTLRSTKRRAPPPPCANTLQELQTETNVTGAVDSLNTLEEQRESDESESVNQSLSSSPPNSQPQSSSSSSCPSLAHLHEVTDPYLLPLFRGKDLSDARCALARVLTSSVSKGTLVKRLKNSATFPKFHNSSSFMSSTPKCSDNGALCTELEAVLTSELPTENEWEDPAQRRGLTTFKVVPSKKLNFSDSEVSLNAPDQSQTSADNHPESEEPLDIENSQMEAEEDLHSPDRSESEAPLASPELCSQDADLSRQDSPHTSLHEAGDVTEGQEDEEEPEVTSEVIPAGLSDCSDGDSTSEAHINPEDQNKFIESPSTDIDQCSSCGVEKKVEEEPEDEEEEVAFPPPPPPVFFNEDIEVMEEEKEDPAASCLSPSPTSNGQTTASSEESTSVTPVDKTSAAPSRFAQAVAMAVQRSRLQSRGKSFGPQVSNGPHSTLPSPPRSTYQYGA
uniref:Cordon-bleu WH2 repeat protein-like 1a n=1 Tax=Amphiprion percula TaxID=161767 RepID=A0A3P8SDS6_AMPPE